MEVGTTNAPQDIGLQLSDLKTMLGIIEIVNQRGAFKADELLTVGMLYNKLAAFVDAAMAQESMSASLADNPDPKNSHLQE